MCDAFFGGVNLFGGGNGKFSKWWFAFFFALFFLVGILFSVLGGIAYYNYTEDIPNPTEDAADTDVGDDTDPADTYKTYISWAGACAFVAPMVPTVYYVKNVQHDNHWYNWAIFRYLFLFLGIAATFACFFYASATYLAILRFRE